MQADAEKEDLEDIDEDGDFDEAEILEDLNPIDSYGELQDFIDKEREADDMIHENYKLGVEEES